MPELGKTSADYSPEGLRRIRQTCLYIMSGIPPALAEDVTIVGGLVPSLLIEDPPESSDPHLGTADLDLGLSLELRGESRYDEFADKLRELHFEPERSEGGRANSIRWIAQPSIASEIVIDVLPVSDDLPATARIPGIELSHRTRFAFLDRERIELSGKSITGMDRKASVWVCGPAAYLVIKALTFANRRLNKDAYDLFYVLKNYGAGVHAIYPRLAPLLKHADAQRALEILRDDFADPNGEGAAAVSLFLQGTGDDDMQADVAGFTRGLLQFFGMA